MATRRGTSHFVQRRLRLGGGLEVSPVCIGIVGDPEVVVRAYARGINFFFLTADMHWPYYQATRDGLELLLRRHPAAREKLVVAATAYVTQPEFCELPFEEVVQSVSGLEHLDLLVAGGSYAHNLAPRLPVFQAHREARFCGCRAVGASFHDRQAARWALENEALDLAFVRFNAAHPGARTDLFPFVPRRRRALVYNFSSTSGWVAPELAAQLKAPSKWRPRVTDHYRLAFSQRGVDGALVSLADPGQLDQLVKALDEGPLEKGQQRHLLQLAASALEHA